MPPAPSLTFASLKQSLAKRQFAPVYLLHGEEAYYIDELVKVFENILPESERDFNLYTIYAPETTADAIAETCTRFPMMSDYQVVIVKEAQSKKDVLTKLADYAANPSKTTILAICSRGETVKAATLTSAIKKSGGVIFESPKVNDRNIAGLIVSLAKDAGLNIEEKGVAMLTEFIGANLAKLHNEISKMATLLPAGATITPESIEQNIGISKDYNTFELIDAIAAKNSLKVYTMIEYFRRTKVSSLAMTPMIFNYFANLLILHFTKDKSPGSLMAALGLKWQSQLKNYETGARNYNAYKVIEIISALREFDTRSKGIGSRQPEYDLFHDLMFRILNAPGDISF
ncbi:MAG: DNA polymerase III subunit delta [Muribaculaceae bacterium]|jgi:DNA polymerase-3 subunit delta|nr:DNA polymerase III subunit delta [Muribaculaceae bacterium]